jgi:hypothetical protein
MNASKQYSSYAQSAHETCKELVCMRISFESFVFGSLLCRQEG